MAKNNYDYPIYLFNEGTNSQAYKLFFPAYVLHEGKKVWRFRVWAPNAQKVSIVGDFNNWKPNVDCMEMIGSTGIWQGFVKGVKKYSSYKYAIESYDGKVVMKADPYATHAETAPNTASKIFDISSYKWSDSHYMSNRKLLNHYENPMNIYEVHLGSWKKNDNEEYLSYRMIADKLIPYVVDMGYTHIELLPITEFPFDGSWGYQTTGLYAPTSRFGTPSDFKYFIDLAHKNNIAVIMDFVVSHFPKDAMGLYEFDGTCQYEYSDSYKQEHKGWGTRVFDYSKPQVRSFLISAVNFWIENYHIDGMRLDAVASMLYLNYDRKDGEWRKNEWGGEYNLEAIYFLQQLNKTILTNHPQVCMIAEESTAFPMITMPPSEGGIGFNYKWNMGWMNDTLDYISIDPFFRKGSHDKLTFGITYAFSENYVLPFSHDEVVHGKRSLIGRVPGEYTDKFAGLKVLMSYLMSHPGKKLSFMGNEFGQFIEWDYKKQLDWFLLDYDSHRLYNKYIKQLNKMYAKESPLYQLDGSIEGFKWIVVDDKIQNVIVFERFNAKKESIIVVLNFSNMDREDYKIGVDEGKYIEILNSDSIDFGGGVEKDKEYNTIDVKNHGKDFSISLDIKANSAIFLKKKNNDKLIK